MYSLTVPRIMILVRLRAQVDVVDGSLVAIREVAWVNESPGLVEVVALGVEDGKIQDSWHGLHHTEFLTATSISENGPSTRIRLWAANRQLTARISPHLPREIRHNYPVRTVNDSSGNAVPRCSALRRATGM